MTQNIVHQLIHTLSYGDAISGETIAMQRALRELGFVSEIYAINVHPHYKARAQEYGVRNYQELRKDQQGEVILHYSLGSPLNKLYRELTGYKRTLIYHNLTPPKWFYGVNPRIVADIESGMSELPELCQISDRLISDSKFNAGELAKFGFSSAVLELPVDPARWSEPANPGILGILRSQPGINLVHIGRIAPNKCIEDVIKVFYFLRHFIDKNARLWLPGIDIDTELYSFSLKRLVHELSLEDSVNFCGCMADSELRALYEAGSLYLCMSEHEGFCVPVIEAMYFGMPVVAFNSSALPDTVGDGGIIFNEKRHNEIAELVFEVGSDTQLRRDLITRGKQRVSELSYDRFKLAVEKLFDKR